MKKVFEAVWAYLKDWRNLLSHAIVGVLILVVGLTLPIPPVYRIGLLLLIVALNIFRMRLSKKKSASLEPISD
jgi:chromate transport protein ChrA